MGYGFKIIAEGPAACFTRPENRLSRISYDVPTPGALEGLLKSVYWRPAIRYVIDQIVVFNSICFQNVRRIFSPAAGEPSSHEPPSALALKNVRYGIAFHFEMTGIQDDAPNPSKQYNMILRRLRKGLCFRQPCFGLSDCPVTSLELVDNFDLNEISPEIRAQGDVDLGHMLYGLLFKESETPHDPPLGQAVYYNPHMIGGVIDVQKYKG